MDAQISIKYNRKQIPDQERSTPMKIALFSETYLPYINGVATHVKTLKEGLEALGHQVLVVTADPKVFGHKLENGVLRCPAMELKEIYGFGLALSRSTRRMELLRGFSPDVVHAHTEFGIGRSAVELAQELDIPMVYTLHTMWDQYLHYVANPSFLPAARRLSHSYFRRFANHADAIIGPSGKSRDFLRMCGVQQEISVIPNAVELDHFSRKRADPVSVENLRQTFGFQKNDIILCFCGRLGPEKSVDLLLEYFAQCRKKDSHLKLLIIGDGPDRTKLETLSRQLKTDHAVIFAGKVPHEAIREMYACCDLFATASRSEVNSISMLEAMAMELPVLHIHDEANAGQVTEGINGYIFHSGEELASIILQFRNSKETVRALLRDTTVNLVKGLDQITLAKRIEEIYRQCITSRQTAEMEIEKEVI